MCDPAPLDSVCTLAECGFSYIAKMSSQTHAHTDKHTHTLAQIPTPCLHFALGQYTAADRYLNVALLLKAVFYLSQCI